jgi:polysaccharide deacetylase family protein (PEP-CTERM system associated)
MSHPESVPVPRQHLVTVALEDYFQVGAFNQLIQRGQWYRFETRLEQNARKALDLLDRFGVKATFFVLGWVADRYPEMVRQVADRGHEIASKGYYHRGIHQMTPAEFREDLARSRQALEKASGTRILGYRVAHRWLTPADLWALDVLAEEGYAYDSSIAPLFRQFAGEPWRRFQHRHEVNGRGLWEFPISSCSLFGLQLPVGGGNYFRQFPHRLVKRAVRQWNRKHAAPFVMYFHVWELDPDQPKINTTSLLTRVRHYRNLDKMEWVLEDYFRLYSFTSMARYLGLDTRPQPGTLPAPEDEATAGPRRTADPRTASDLYLPPNGADDTMPDLPAAEQAGKTAVSIVIPCFNEELILPYLSNTLKRVQTSLGERFDLRFVFVDDGSRDGTWESLGKIFGSWPRATLLRHERNRGVAAAILTGLRRADTEVVCSIDCDCTYDPHELGRMIPLLTPGVAMVTASPYHPQGQVRNVPGWRLLLSRGASFLYRRVLRQKLHTYTSCFRVYRRSAVAALEVRETGYLGIAEMLGRLDLQGARVVEHPATLEVRMLGCSKMKTLRTIRGHLRLLARLAWLRLFGRTPPAAAAPPPAAVTTEPPAERTTPCPERTTA